MRAPSALLVVLLVAVLAPAAPAGDFLVTGRCTYLDREWDWDGFTGQSTERPVRRADVALVDAQTGRPLGRGTTGPDGEYAFTARSAVVRDVRVRVLASTRWQRRFAGPFEPVTVVDESGQTWSLDGPVVPAHDPADGLDAGTLMALPVSTGGSQGNPFNLLDQAVCAFELVSGPPTVAPVRGRLVLHWPSWSGSWTLGSQAHLAADDADDDAVVLHEIGHMVHATWSDSDSPGGAHWFGDSNQDPRLSFAEGFDTAFAGQVLAATGRPAIYVDADPGDAGGGLQLRLDLETSEPWGASAAGAADEVAVATILFDLLDDEAGDDATPGSDDDGFRAATLVDGEPPARAWWEVFTGPVRRARRLTLNDAWDGWIARHAADPHYEDLRAVFDRRDVRFWRDAWEPDGTPEAATPLLAAPVSDWGSEHTLYACEAEPAERGTGDRDWFALELLAGQVVRIETRYPQGAADARTEADTFLSLFDPSGTRRATDDDSGTGRNALIDAFEVDLSGTWRVEVRSRDRTLRYGRYEIGATLLPGP